MPDFENKIIEVCSECGRACCYQGEFMCAESRTAGTELMTVAELREKQYGEHERYWSDERLREVYGDPSPHSYSEPPLSRGCFRGYLGTVVGLAVDGRDHTWAIGDYQQDKAGLWDLVAEYFTHR